MEFFGAVGSVKGAGSQRPTIFRRSLLMREGIVLQDDEDEDDGRVMCREGEMSSEGEGEGEDEGDGEGDGGGADGDDGCGR